MKDFRVWAQSAEKFKRISGSKLRGKYAMLVKKVLETSNVIPLNYPEVEVDGVVYQNKIIILKVTNLDTEEYVEFNMPSIDINGTITFKTLEIGQKSNEEGMWHISFTDYHFTATLTNVMKNSAVKCMTVAGFFAGVTIYRKMNLICSMVKKMEFFFLYQTEYSPTVIVDVLCQALVISPSNLLDFKIAIGKDTILSISNGEIAEAIERKKNCTVKSTAGIAKYYAENFELTQNQKNQCNRIRFESQFEGIFNAEEINAKIKSAQDEMVNLLCEIACYNEKKLITIIKY